MCWSLQNLLSCKGIKSNSNWLKLKKKKTIFRNFRCYLSSGIPGCSRSNYFLLCGLTSQAGSSLCGKDGSKNLLAKPHQQKERTSCKGFLTKSPRIVFHWPSLSHTLPTELDSGLKPSGTESWESWSPKGKLRGLLLY